MFKSDSQTNINTVEFNFSTVLDYIFVIKVILVGNVREVLFVAYWETIFPPEKNEIFIEPNWSNCGRTLYLDKSKRMPRCYKDSRVSVEFSSFSLELS